MNLDLTLEEAVAIVNILAELPTKSGVYPLVMKIKAQTDAVIETQANTTPTTTPAPAPTEAQ